MKTTSKVWVLVAAGMTALSALAVEQTKDSKTAKATPVSDKTKAAQSQPANNCQGKERLVTGSLIPHKVKRAGLITDGSSQVLVLDRSAIEQSGAADTKQLLIHRGIR